LKDPEILNSPIWFRLLYHYVSITSQRFKYYLAWTVADIVCNASGLGFTGYDENGKPKWDLCTSVNIFQLEVILNSLLNDSIRLENIFQII
jgi:lysophospholipid acyltransferase 1/2